MTFVRIRLLRDIYIVQEIARKCQKESAGSDRALRNAAFLYSGILRLESQTDFIDLSSRWMFPRLLMLAAVIPVVVSNKWAIF